MDIIDYIDTAMLHQHKLNPDAWELEAVQEQQMFSFNTIDAPVSNLEPMAFLIVYPCVNACTFS